jgi:hypothetical protein
MTSGGDAPASTLDAAARTRIESLVDRSEDEGCVNLSELGQLVDEALRRQQQANREELLREPPAS